MIKELKTQDVNITTNAYGMDIKDINTNAISFITNTVLACYTNLPVKEQCKVDKLIIALYVKDV